VTAGDGRPAQRGLGRARGARAGRSWRIRSRDSRRRWRCSRRATRSPMPAWPRRRGSTSRARRCSTAARRRPAPRSRLRAAEPPEPALAPVPRGSGRPAGRRSGEHWPRSFGRPPDRASRACHDTSSCTSPRGRLRQRRRCAAAVTRHASAPTPFEIIRDRRVRPRRPVAYGPLRRDAEPPHGGAAARRGLGAIPQIAAQEGRL